MKRKFFVILATLAMVLTFAPTALAGTQGSSCSGDTTQVLLWENSIGDTSDNNDNYWKCSNDSNLNSGDDHTLPGDCHATPFNNGNWNDCVSSFTAYIPSGWYLCFYGNSDYNKLYPYRAYSSAYNGIRTAAPWNDGISSFRWLTSSLC